MAEPWTQQQSIEYSTDAGLRGVAVAHGGEAEQDGSWGWMADRATQRITAMTLSSDTQQGGTVRVDHNAESPRDMPSSSQRDADDEVGSGPPREGGRLHRNTTLESAREDSEWPDGEVSPPEATPSDEQWRPRRASDTKPRVRLEVQTGALKGRSVLCADDSTQVSVPSPELVVCRGCSAVWRCSVERGESDGGGGCHRSASDGRRATTSS